MNTKLAAGLALAVVAAILVAGLFFLRPEKSATESDEGQTTSVAGARQPASSGGANGGGTTGSGSAKSGSSTTPKAPPNERPILAEEGAKLSDVTQPPAKTVAMFDLNAATPNTKYVVAFAPYGVTGQELVIAVSTSKLDGGGEGKLDLAGRNMLVRAESDIKAKVSVGGRYGGVIQLREEGGLLVPYLIAAESK